MGENKKPVTPVKPSNLELLYFYTCPFCGKDTPLASPTQAAMARCMACDKSFPIVPVDARTVRFVKIMLASGKAAIDPDFL